MELIIQNCVFFIDTTMELKSFTTMHIQASEETERFMPIGGPKTDKARDFICSRKGLIAGVLLAAAIIAGIIAGVMLSSDDDDTAHTRITDSNIQTAVNLWCYEESKAKATYGAISDWDTSDVTKMSMLFLDKATFNDDISKWDVSKVTTMQQMFKGAQKFNQDITGWDTSKVTNMEAMFYDAQKFNQDITGWDTSHVTNVKQLLYHAKSFNQDMNKMKFDKVTDNASEMFVGTIINRPVDMPKVLPKSSKRTGHCKDVHALSDNCDTCDDDFTGTVTCTCKDPNKFKVHSSGYCSRHFAHSGSTNPPVHRDTDIRAELKELAVGSYSKAASDPKLLSGWHTEHVTDMSYFFCGKTSVSNKCMAQNAKFNIALSGWNVGKVTDMRSMFDGAAQFDQDISGWDVDKNVKLDHAFRGAIALSHPLNGDHWKAVLKGKKLCTDSYRLADDCMSCDATRHYLLNTKTNKCECQNKDNDPTAEIEKGKAVDHPGFIGRATFVEKFFPAKDDLSGPHCVFQPLDHDKSEKLGKTKAEAESESKKKAEYGTTIKAAVNYYFMIASTGHEQAVKELSHMKYWDTSKVTDMSGLFDFDDTYSSQTYAIQKFDHDLSAWDVSKVTSMSKMFKGLIKYNQDISAWDVGNVEDMSYMFEGAPYFNQPLKDWVKPEIRDKEGAIISPAKTMKLKNAQGMFKKAESFNQDITGWDMSKAVDLSSMFEGAVEFSQDIGKWKTGSVTNMNKMFSGSGKFDGDVADLNVEKVTDMSFMFEKAIKFNKPVNKWKPNAATTMKAMFKGADIFNEALFTLPVDTPKLTDVSQMFQDAKKFNKDLSLAFGTAGKKQLEAVTTTAKMFLGSTSFNNGATQGSSKSGNGDDGLSNWDLSSVQTMNLMFSEAESFNSKMFAITDDHKVTDMSGMFKGATRFNADLSKWKPIHVTTTEGMFNDATIFKGTGLQSWRLPKVQTMQDMFDNADAFNEPINAWGKDENDGLPDTLVSTAGMFFDTATFNQPLNDWDWAMKYVKDMSEMFANTKSFDQDLRSWKEFDRLVDASKMFVGAKAMSWRFPYNKVRETDVWKDADTDSLCGGEKFALATKLSADCSKCADKYVLNDKTGQCTAKG